MPVEADLDEGMLVGIHSRNNDLVVNPLKGKQLTNIRAAGTDDESDSESPRAKDAGKAQGGRGGAGRGGGGGKGGKGGARRGGRTGNSGGSKGTSQKTNTSAS